MKTILITGGGRANSCSILEAFTLAEEISGRNQVHTYVEESRVGDPICSYSDLGKMQTHYPAWGGTESLRDIVTEVVGSWRERLGT